MVRRRVSARAVLLGVLVLSLVAGLVVVGVLVWQRQHRTDLDQALDAVPARSLRVGFTDWGTVRTRLKALSSVARQGRDRGVHVPRVRQ